MPVPSAGDVIVLQQQQLDEEAPQVGSLLEGVYKLRSDTRDSISSTDSDVSLSYDDDNGAVSPPPTAQLLGVSSTASELSSASDSEGCKDSGCEAPAEEDAFVPPDEQMAARIVQQVEFYFSDVNITKDAFLLKHVKRNKEGYVSLKLISSFKRVKHLAKDWRVVAHALANGSSMLQVNEARTKLRRIAPLPRYDDTAPSRTVVALELPLEKPTIESVVDLFAPCGKLALVRILRPGNPVPADVRPFVAGLPELATAVCALIEFEDLDGSACALKRRPACAQAAPLTQWGQMRVLALAQKQSLDSTAASGGPAAAGPQQGKERKKRTAKPKQQRPPSAGYESACPSDAEFDMSRRRSSTASSVSSSRSSPLCSPLRSLQNIQNSPLFQFVNAEPYVPRRLSACYIPPPASPLAGRPRSNTTPNVLRTLPENVLRLPRGPDGTKGFRQRLMQEASRARSVSAPVCPAAAVLAL